MSCSIPSRAALVCAAAVMFASHAAAAPLTLSEALRRARDAHPTLRAARAEARAAEARVSDARRAPAFTLGAELEDLGAREGADAAQATLTLGRTLERGGDRAARAGLATGTALAASARAEALARELDAEVAEAFLDAWRAHARRALAAEALARAERAAEAAGERLRAGAAPASERARAAGFVALRAIESRRAARDEALAARRLARAWGADSLDADSLALPVPAEPASSAAPAVAERLAHPARRLAEAEVTAAEWRVRAARAARVADLDAALGARRLAGGEGAGLVATVSMPLPFGRAGAGELAAAGAELDAARARADATTRALAHEALDARATLAAAAESWRLADGALSAAADDALRSVTDAYRAGRAGYPDIAEAQRSRLEAEEVRLDALAELWRARAALARITGTPLTDEEDGR
jgi:outer membrane protein, heavy metal efflux system